MEAVHLGLGRTKAAEGARAKRLTTDEKIWAILCESKLKAFPIQRQVWCLKWCPPANPKAPEVPFGAHQNRVTLVPITCNF